MNGLERRTRTGATDWATRRTLGAELDTQQIFAIQEYVDFVRLAEGMFTRFFVIQRECLAFMHK